MDTEAPSYLLVHSVSCVVEIETKKNPRWSQTFSLESTKETV